MLTLPDILGWIANVLFVIGAFLIAGKNPREGMGCNILANFIYIIVGVLINLPSLIILSILLFIINAYGYWNYGRDNHV